MHSRSYSQQSRARELWATCCCYYAPYYSVSHPLITTGFVPHLCFDHYFYYCFRRSFSASPLHIIVTSYSRGFPYYHYLLHPSGHRIAHPWKHHVVVKYFSSVPLQLVLPPRICVREDHAFCIIQRFFNLFLGYVVSMTENICKLVSHSPYPA